MKTPDKIYISPNIENRTWLIGKADTTNIEYIRKDALIEWAREEIEQSKAFECISEVAYEKGRQQVALNLIEKLNLM